jgi:hypothetical protein
MTDDRLAEIDAWLARFGGDKAEQIAIQAYADARKAHQGGEFPRHIRPYWDQLPRDYRAFLISIARLALEVK